MRFLSLVAADTKGRSEVTGRSTSLLQLLRLSGSSSSVSHNNPEKADVAVTPGNPDAASAAGYDASANASTTTTTSTNSSSFFFGGHNAHSSSTLTVPRRSRPSAPNGGGRSSSSSARRRSFLGLGGPSRPRPRPASTAFEGDPASFASAPGRTADERLIEREFPHLVQRQHSSGAAIGTSTEADATSSSRPLKPRPTRASLFLPGLVLPCASVSGPASASVASSSSPSIASSAGGGGTLHSDFVFNTLREAARKKSLSQIAIEGGENGRRAPPPRSTSLAERRSRSLKLDSVSSVSAAALTNNRRSKSSNGRNSSSSRPPLVRQQHVDVPLPPPPDKQHEEVEVVDVEVDVFFVGAEEDEDPSAARRKRRLSRLRRRRIKSVPPSWRQKKMSGGNSTSSSFDVAPPPPPPPVCAAAGVPNTLGSVISVVFGVGFHSILLSFSGGRKICQLEFILWYIF